VAYVTIIGAVTDVHGTVPFQHGHAPKRGAPIKTELPVQGEDNRLRSLVLTPGESGESVSYRVSLVFPKLSYQDVALPLPIGLVSAFGNVDCSSPDEGELDECFTVPVF
jgi:hypothetical protein